MAGKNYRFAMDQKNIVKLLVTTVGSFIQDRLIDKEMRIQHKEQCAERLAAEDGSSEKDGEVRYSDQAVLANLDWGIEALEEAIETSNMETKMARLDYAEKMLQVCSMMNSKEKTAGVPNFYLSAWAHLNLAYLWKLRNNVQNSVLHVLEMFIVDPFFSRIDFAPELWKELFLPQMSSITGWYSESRHRLMMEVIPDSSDLSLTADFDQFFNESLIFSMRPDQMEKLQNLEQLYGESLDETTRLFSKYYKDCMNKKVIHMLPIAEPPMTPRHEVSRSIPDYVKFGPILPKSAGFSPVFRSNGVGREDNRITLNSAIVEYTDESAEWSPQAIPEENEDESDYEHDEVYVDSVETFPDVAYDKGVKENKDKGTGSAVQPAKTKNQAQASTVFSPMDSPKTSAPKVSSSEANANKKETKTLLSLFSARIPDSKVHSLHVSPRMGKDYIVDSPDSDGDVIRHSRKTPSISCENVNSPVFGKSSVNDSCEGSYSNISLPSSEKKTTVSRPPKDFVCPITNQLFNDPITLETGQTYERKAIKEWLKRGYSTCPITRQPLSSSALPKTNYVLKRLITSWKEQHPDLAQEFSYAETPKNSFSSPRKEAAVISPSFTAFALAARHKSVDDHINQRSKRFMLEPVDSSPTSVIAQAAVERIISALKPFILSICTTKILQECETAVLAIARLWKESKGDASVHSYLSEPTIVHGLVEILSASLNREVLITSVYVLSELTFYDENVGEILKSVDSDFECLAALLKNGLAEAAVLIYQLKPTFSQLSFHELIPHLVQIITTNNEGFDDLQFVMEPKDVSISMLEQILMGGDENIRTFNALSVITANGLAPLIKCLDRVEVRRSIVSILLCCMQAEKGCRTFIANRIEVLPVLDLFHSGNDSIRGICVDFLFELVQLNRRTQCNQILKAIKDKGAFSTMHTFLVYLQTASLEHQTAVATLLLQLDLLVEPWKMSIYREEAMEALIEALCRKDFTNSQMMALSAMKSLSGRITISGESYIEAWLLNIAGFDQPCNALMKAEQDGEEKAASSWEKRVAFVLCNHEKGSIFKALEECFKSNSLEMVKSCLVIATWLIHMLSQLPDTGVKKIAFKYLLGELVNVLQSSNNQEEKILAALALKTFFSDPALLEELGKYAKSIYKGVRKLKTNSVVVTDILKALMNISSVNAAELWNCKEVEELDSSTNGEVLCLTRLNGRIVSSHSDGTIKVWDAGNGDLRLIKEVREHTKAVTCLYVPSSGDKLYSGSLDKTIRVWVLKLEEIYCLQVHDVEEPVYALTANAEVACYTSQGAGVKVYNWSRTPKHVNFHKHVKCLAMAEDKTYCGCSGYTIQELDSCNFTSTTLCTGTRKLRGKQFIQSLLVHDGLLYAGGSSFDGTAGKVFSLSTKATIGTFSTGFDIQQIAITSDFMITASRIGIIEVWLNDKFTKVASIKVCNGTSSKLTAMVTDRDAGMLYIGTSDGKIQVWCLE